MSLKEKKCVPCEGGVPKLTEREVAGLLPELAGWEARDDRLSKRYTFADFAGAMGFVNDVAGVAEAERITGAAVADEAGMERAARELVRMGARAALVKGGHLDLGGLAVDVLYDGVSVHTFSERRVETTSTHGTGCTLASAVASGLALGKSLPVAVAAAKSYVTQAIRQAPGLGRGNGPINHFYVQERS